MSRTAIIWSTVVGSSAIASLPSWSAGRSPGEVQFSMKNTGRSTTCEGKPSERTFSSTRHLFSKCGMPVRRWAEPTDE